MLLIHDTLKIGDYLSFCGEIRYVTALTKNHQHDLRKNFIPLHIGSIWDQQLLTFP